MLWSVFVAVNMQHEFNIQTNYKGKVQEKSRNERFSLQRESLQKKALNCKNCLEQKRLVCYC